MRFTEHELTVAMTGVARQVAAARAGGRGKGRTADPDDVWEQLGRYERYQVLTAVGDQLLAAMVALPDVEVEPGTRPAFTDDQVRQSVEETMGDDGGKLRRKATVAARTALLKTALAQLPPRQDPDGLVVPDSLEGL
jgi:hypothetical protein